MTFKNSVLNEQGNMCLESIRDELLYKQIKAVAFVICSTFP